MNIFNKLINHIKYKFIAGDEELNPFDPENHITFSSPSQIKEYYDWWLKKYPEDIVRIHEYDNNK